MEKNIGLVLCGGAARGAYQIGEWEALEHYGIMDKVRAVSGTSVGALNAVLFALGDRKFAVDTWRNIYFNDMIKPGKDSILSRKCVRDILDRCPLERLKYCGIDVYVTVYNKSVKMIEYVRINDLPVETMKSYLLGSSSMRVVYKAEKIDGEKYKDPGRWEYYNTPVKPVYDCGCNEIYILTLDKSFSAEKIRKTQKIRKYRKKKIFYIKKHKRHISASKEFPDADIISLVPPLGLGSVLKFRNKNLLTLMSRGRNEAENFFEEHGYNIVNDDCAIIIDKYDRINRELKSLIKEKFTTQEQLREFLYSIDIDHRHPVMKKGKRHFWSDIVRLDNMVMQQHLIGAQRWDHYRIVETITEKRYDHKGNRKKDKVKKRCIMYTFKIEEFLGELQKYKQKQSCKKE
ncbi:MAG: patatin-like phospholipase family protein [Oscillospiraceae bacterium]|nr:patatin-like phospholipase family protein [Oscillospiraceae bacterium]